LRDGLAECLPRGLGLQEHLIEEVQLPASFRCEGDGLSGSMERDLDVLVPKVDSLLPRIRLRALS
jgi:hypothetical protein